jgi:hypothetical protein
MKKKIFKVLFGVTFVAISASGFVFSKQGKIANFSLTQVMAATGNSENSSNTYPACVAGDGSCYYQDANLPGYVKGFI